ncbi:hypothetical protein B5F86_08300 [Lachnoclostridium sp. An298]|nr:hypothetical protein B5F86_08300 [Lachnoclostridium sp. An298]
MAGILIFPLQPGEIVCRPGVQCCFLNFEIPILKFTDQVNAAANIFLYRLVSSGKIVSKAAVYNRGKSVLGSIGIIIAAVEIIVVLDLSQPGKSCFGYKNTNVVLVEEITEGRDTIASTASEYPLADFRFRGTPAPKHKNCLLG